MGGKPISTRTQTPIVCGVDFFQGLVALGMSLSHITYFWSPEKLLVGALQCATGLKITRVHMIIVVAGS